MEKWLDKKFLEKFFIHDCIKPMIINVKILLRVLRVLKALKQENRMDILRLGYQWKILTDITPLSANRLTVS